MKKTAASLLAAAAAMTFAASAQAQMGPTTPFAVEVRGGAAIPTGDAGDALDTGFTFGVNGQYMFTPMLGAYAGFDYNSFGFSDEVTGGEDVDADFNVSGFNAGVIAQFSPMGGFAPFVKGGIVLYEAEISGEGASISGDRETGFQVGGGVAVPLGQRISVTPAVVYTDVEDTSWVDLGVGLKFRI